MLKLDIDKQAVLINLIEECAEVQQAATKILRFGANNYCPHSKVNNATRLRTELADLQAMIQLCTHADIVSVSPSEVMEAFTKKLETVGEMKDANSND